MNRDAERAVAFIYGETVIRCFSFERISLSRAPLAFALFLPIRCHLGKWRMENVYRRQTRDRVRENESPFGGEEIVYECIGVDGMCERIMLPT